VNPARTNLGKRVWHRVLPSALLSTFIPLAAHAQSSSVEAFEEDPDSAALAQTLAFAIDSTDEGPHIYWADESTAYVLYMCNGTVIYRNGTVADSLAFDGFCSDSATHYSLDATRPEIEPFVFENVPRIFTVSDIHGEYEALVDLLKNAGVIDRNLHWNFGDGHLVVLGDVFDRGDKVTETLWLIYRLENEAKRSGGRVHFTLGNHEQMALTGDLRYVHDKYVLGISARTRIPYDDLFGPHMELGRWLRTKHTAIRLNDIIFIHGGLSPEAVERGLTLETINKAVRRSLDFRSYELLFSELEWFLLSDWGPLWYRGYHEARPQYPRATAAQIDTILEYYDAEAIVVGHHEITRVDGWYHNRVYGIDVPLEELGGLQGLLWENGVFFRVLGTGVIEPLSRS
jgi:hypothetical protein